MNRNVNLLVVGDMNNEQGRALAQAITDAPELNTPYHLVHIDEVRNVLPGIRATPAVGVVLWASDLQEAVAIADVAREADYLSAQAEVTSALDNAPDEVAVALPVGIYDTWQAQTHYKADKLLRHGTTLYRVVQEHDSQEHQPPDAEGMLAIYRPIEPSHEGTIADPIPWVYGMDCTAGLYYIHSDALYLCAGDMKPCVWEPGTAGVWQWEAVSV